MITPLTKLNPVIAMTKGIVIWWVGSPQRGKKMKYGGHHDDGHGDSAHQQRQNQGTFAHGICPRLQPSAAGY